MDAHCWGGKGTRMILILGGKFENCDSFLHFTLTWVWPHSFCIISYILQQFFHLLHWDIGNTSAIASLNLIVIIHCIPLELEFLFQLWMSRISLFSAFRYRAAYVFLYFPSWQQWVRGFSQNIASLPFRSSGSTLPLYCLLQFPDCLVIKAVYN